MTQRHPKVDEDLGFGLRELRAFVLQRREQDLETLEGWSIGDLAGVVHDDAAHLFARGALNFRQLVGALLIEPPKRRARRSLDFRDPRLIASKDVILEVVDQSA